MTDQNSDQEGMMQPQEPEVNARRRVLKLGAIAVPAIATLTPSMAMATGGGVGGANISILACQVPIPDYIDENGEQVPPNKQLKTDYRGQAYYYKNGKKVDVFNAPSQGHYSGQEIKDGYINRRYIHDAQFKAHVEYLQKMRNSGTGGAGISCLMSITNSSYKT
ncbi:hypothetical protein ACSMXM_01745 [Pacificimonas sp. ICDLI1SI03]